ncbi:hypothetical protein Tgr7_2015 [Thioalkalivibrio sulfidiphilus HL-EbGr7]|uniref:DUF945 domain-containing protein n=1 Tax=Thioalkalivibrio sulfidiphilus (strain HL-EbGR7) TaxID=396588 RepID=B8GT80_THISH|nr:DUF945 family protein [Thioalkalivibrio sulfidiphilus]ACL73095.1 hypothetical protein Tgr7_2015 [Thioalkalivibrio sulfidiphilus HL-EbGr7]
MTAKRLLLLPLLLLAALILAWPIWLGGQAQRHLDNWQGGNLGDMRVDHRLEVFERGWFTSSATSQLHLVVQGEPVDFAMRHRIRHGYGALTLESEPVYPDDVAERLRAVFGDRVPLSLHTVIDPITDSAELRITSPAFETELPEEPGSWLRSAGMEGVFQWNRQRLVGGLELPELEMRDADSHVRLRGQRLDLDLTDPGNRLADGWFEYRVDVLDLEGHDQQGPLHLERLRLRSGQNRQGEFLHLHFDLGFGALRVADWESTGGDMRLRLGPLHGEVYDLFLERLEGLNELDEVQAGEMAGLILLQSLPYMLVHSPALNLETLRLRMPEGELELKLSARFDGEGFDPNTVDYLPRLGLDGRFQGGKALLEGLAGEISLRSMEDEEGTPMDPALREMLTRSLGRGVMEGLVEQGYMVAGEDAYRAELELRDSRLTLNGQDQSQWLYLLLMGLFASGGFN